VTQYDGYAAHFNADTSGVMIEHLDISGSGDCWVTQSAHFRVADRRLTTMPPRRMRMERPESTGAERARRRAEMRARRGQPVVSFG